ncbi:MAG: transcription elongation factor GreA [Eubacteriales bacterium]|nr:transcription elongation factor GreA [Clostridiales bacterium]MDY5836314.1 transcription elongation factor GreA [Eubacteriales bacterium]
MNEIFEMTPDGIRELQDELEQRKTSISIEIAERLKEARAQGDLSENSEYDDAKEAQTNNEVRIAEIEKILKNAKVIEKSDILKTKVSLGQVVELLDIEEDESQEYILVSPHEEDIMKNKISSDSPVGAAILGHKKNDIVEVKTPIGIIRYKILRIGKSN